MTGISESLSRQGSDGGDSWPGKRLPSRNTWSGSTRRNAIDNELIRKGKRSAQLLTKARILLKADVSDAGEGWSDSRIAAALDTSIANCRADHAPARRRRARGGAGPLIPIELLSAGKFSTRRA